MTGGDPSIFDSKLRRWQASDTDKLKAEYTKNYEELQVCQNAGCFMSMLQTCILPILVNKSKELICGVPNFSMRFGVTEMQS